MKKRSIQPVAWGLIASWVIAVFGLVPLGDPPRLDAASTVHADASTGDDATGDGTSANPYRSFHKAYSMVNAGGTIRLAGTFTWTDADEAGDVSGTGYTLAKNLTILGDGRSSTIVQAASTRGTADRMVFFVAANTTVTIRDLTIRHGRVTGEKQGGGLTLAGQYCGNYPCASITGTATLERVDVVANNAAPAANVTYRAGGVYMREASTLTLIDSSVSDNICSCRLYSAGGIAGGEQSQSLTIVNSTISGNVATSTSGSTFAFSYASVAGAIALQRFGRFVLTNSTIHGNTTDNYGTVLLHYQTRPIITNATIAGNSASLGAGGILWSTNWYGDHYRLNIKNTLLADNTGVSGAADDFYAKNDAGNTYATDHVSATHSIIESSTNKSFAGSSNLTGNQSSLDLAGTLATNDGTNGTQTLAIGASSVAIDAGNSAAHGVSGFTVTPPSRDQRGATRIGNPDIGAFERGGTLPTTTTTSTTTTSTTSTTTTTVPVATTTTVVASVTTSTAQPSAATVAPTPVTTVSGDGGSSPTPPVAAGPTGPDVAASATSTTIAAARAAQATPAIQATTPTTTTVAATPAELEVDAPSAPDVVIGTAAAFVNGEPVELSISRENNTLTITGAGVTMTLAAVLDDGTIIPLDPDGNIRLEQTRLLQLTSMGVALESETEVWIYSEPIMLGRVKPDATGAITARLAVPDDVPGGDHRFVVKTRTQSGDETTLAVGIGVGAAPEGVAIEWLIGVPLSLAVAMALIIPATRRRRRQMAAT